MNHEKVEHDLTKMRKTIDEAKDKRYRAEARLEELENQEKRLLEELEDLGVKPEELENEITRLERQIEEELEKAWNMIPKELIKNGND
ncbi:hypothetical protein [Alkalihalobacillus trypoxylicola]|uniref:Viral A-type inclusion protein n=1 Tax=Alkalihalobacillus trypoxylicola TaxID=519424 RepID=A0A161PKZ5_9BACI|nr:hypothetical protein [Alkalihalobacillus trypoxylicola]KYG34986.1 hypothetical protein AZF04_01235 [Alkalihalobacillus trypoxylicola]GAF63576.1 hypothetical protein BTS2_0467 [Bacillus sp. TS-2]